MKKLILAGLCSLNIAAFAQITVTKNDLIKVGQTVVQAYTDGTFALPAGGANKTWNFSSLTADSKDTFKFGLNSWYEGYTNFPGSTHGIDNGDSSWTFLKLDDNELSVMGGYNIYNGEGSVDDFRFKLLALPATFNKLDKDSFTVTGEPSEFGLDPDGIGPLPFIDSIQIGYKTLSTLLVDAWGKLTTPLGTYDVLRSNSQQITSINLKLKTGGLWIVAPKAVVDLVSGGSSTDTSVQHFYFTNQASIGFPIMNYSLTSAMDSITDVSWTFNTPQFSSIENNQLFSFNVYPNPTSNVLNIASSQKVLRVTLYAADGRIVNSASGYQSVQLNMNDLAAGTYLVKIKDNQGNTETHSVIKN